MKFERSLNAIEKAYLKHVNLCNSLLKRIEPHIEYDTEETEFGIGYQESDSCHTLYDDYGNVAPLDSVLRIITDNGKITYSEFHELCI